MYGCVCDQAIDAAKKRAVAQFCDYDTFKNLVAVAHLRPIQAPNLKQDRKHHQNIAVFP